MEKVNKVKVVSVDHKIIKYKNNSKKYNLKKKYIDFGNDKTVNYYKDWFTLEFDWVVYNKSNT